MSADGGLANLAKTWNPPAELAASPPRPVRLSGTGIMVIVLAVMMVAGSAVLGVNLSSTVARETETARLITEQGAETDGAVTRLWRSGRKRRNFRVAYRFQIQGQVFDSESNAPREVWQSLSEGSRLRVRYAVSDPTMNRPADWDPRTTPEWLPWLISVIFVIVAVILLWSLRRQRQLLEDGRAAPGVVTSSRRVKHGLRIRYDFLLPAGSQASGSGKVRRGTVDTGSVITVVYDPDNPGRNSPYSLELARPGE